MDEGREEGGRSGLFGRFLQTARGRRRRWMYVEENGVFPSFAVLLFDCRNSPRLTLNDDPNQWRPSHSFAVPFATWYSFFLYYGLGLYLTLSLTGLDSNTCRMRAQLSSGRSS